MRDPRPATPPPAGILDTIKAVAWSFFGVRAGRARERDFTRLNPVHVIIVGLAMALLFVLTLVAIVHAVAG